MSHSHKSAVGISTLTNFTVKHGKGDAAFDQLSLLMRTVPFQMEMYSIKPDQVFSALSQVFPEESPFCRVWKELLGAAAWPDMQVVMKGQVPSNKPTAEQVGLVHNALPGTIKTEVEREMTTMLAEVLPDEKAEVSVS